MFWEGLYLVFNFVFAHFFIYQKFAKSLLDVSDNLSRAINAIEKIDLLEQSESYRNLVEGVNNTQKQLQKVFSDHGVKEFNPLGEKFNGNRMNALMKMEPSEIEQTPGHVGLVLKTGYTLQERIIRAADVGVVVEKE